jgi:hypothetical protein
MTNQIKRVPHPAFSRGLVPSYFYLFDKLKDLLNGFSLEYGNEFLRGVMGL